jgi:transposase
MLAADAVQQANSGHPGMPMGAADMAFVLWTRHLRFDPKEPRWIGRDRFVLSAGHGSMLLYSLLHLAGFDCTIEDLKKFRQLHSRTPGTEFGYLPGVGTATARQGFANRASRSASDTSAKLSPGTARDPSSTRSSRTAISWRASRRRRRASPGTTGSAGSSTSTTTTRSPSTAARRSPSRART